MEEQHLINGKKNGGNVGTNSSIYNSATLVNNDIISCVMTSSVVCIAGSPANSNNITMTVNPVVPVNLSVSTSPQGAICAGTNVVFTANASNDGANPVYEWRKNGNVVGANSKTYSDSTLINADMVSCKLTSNAPCISGNPFITTSVIINVIPLSSPKVSISYLPGGMICSGKELRFIATSVYEGSSPFYQWVKNDTVVGTNNSIYIDSGLINTDEIYCIINSNAPCISKTTDTSNVIQLAIEECPVNLNLSVYFEPLYSNGFMPPVLDPSTHPNAPRRSRA